MKKRLGSIVLCLALLISSTLFGACGQSSSASSSQPAEAAPASSTATETSTPAETEEPEGDVLKIAMVCSNPINDGSWGTSGYNALMSLEEKFGAQVAYSEQVSIDEIPTVLRTYGREGYDIIFAHSMEFDEQMKRVAPEFPETSFVTVNGFNNGGNLYCVQFKYWELQYFMGLAGGLASETGKMGVVHAMDTPMVALERQAMEQGAKFANPDCTVDYSFTGDWNDVAKVKEATRAQLDSGIDVVHATVSSCTQAIFDACAEKGAWAIGWGDDQTSLAPDTVLICGLFNLNDLYAVTVQKILDGVEERDLQLTMRDGALGCTEISKNLPEEKQQIFKDRLEAYMNGEFEITVEQ